MKFLLRSEIDTLDPAKGYIRKRPMCPECRETQIKVLDKNAFYTKYKCWNKLCAHKESPFIIINELIENELNFDFTCSDCGEPLIRHFENHNTSSIYLTFRCADKFCATAIEPYKYNLNRGRWEGLLPSFAIIGGEEELDALEPPIKTKPVKEKAHPPKMPDPVSELSKTIEKVKTESKLEEKRALIRKMFPIGQIPLLSMDSKAYTRFLAYHNEKAVVFVDVPNLIRTLHRYFPNKFEEILNKAHTGLIQFIKRSFGEEIDYIIRYYTKPDVDLDGPNTILEQICHQSPETEFYHLLKIQKALRYSDIDNYIIANSVEVIERCELKGFAIVSSDKDYLPVMRIANFRNVKASMMGVDTPEIYGEYNITDIKFLGIMRFLQDK